LSGQFPLARSYLQEREKPMIAQSSSSPVQAQSCIVERVCGVDVSKLSLDAHFLGPQDQSHPREHAVKVDYDPKGMGKLVEECVRRQVQLVVLEATGGLQRPLHLALHAAGIAVAVANPARVRHFANAQGQRAKTDPLDARTIASFALRMAPAVTPPRCALDETIARLNSRRSALVKILVAEKNREESESEADCLKSITKHLKWLEREIQQIDKKMDKLISGQEELERKVRLADEITGIGRVSAVALVVNMPELGRVNRRQAAALAGLAPYNNDSGQRQGKRSIHGGRSHLRTALYMPTLTAIRCPGKLQEMYQRLLARGKCKMQALTACMRKLLIMVNARVAQALAAQALAKPPAAAVALSPT
jgi:transposase